MSMANQMCTAFTETVNERVNCNGGFWDMDTCPLGTGLKPIDCDPPSFTEATKQLADGDDLGQIISSGVEVKSLLLYLSHVVPMLRIILWKTPKGILLLNSGGKFSSSGFIMPHAVLITQSDCLPVKSLVMFNIVSSVI